jgi:hypothetical protein
MVNFFKRTDNLIIIIVAFFIMMILTGYSQIYKVDKDLESSKDELYLSSFLKTKKDVLDTVFTDNDRIIEVRLDLQQVLLHKKKLGTDTFLCSTGTNIIKDGIQTNHGIFVVKNKIPVLISKQFNDTKCINWVGFNYGIGFHALENRGYYWSLGKRSSSHGCVRLSQEDAKKLFDEVTIGTPVIVHSLNNARVVGFLPEHSNDDITYTKKELKQILNNRLSLLYKQKYFYKQNIAVVLNDKLITHDGIDIGDKTKVPIFQSLPVQSDGFIIKTCIEDKSSVFYSVSDSFNNYIKYAVKDTTSVN